MKVGLDVDGVLADFYLSMCERYSQPYVRINDWNGVDHINDNLDDVKGDMEFWRTLRILNAPTFLDFDFDYYITSIPEDVKEAREYWLKNNGFPDKPVVVSHDKVTTCRELGVKILIDDKPGTMLKFNKEPDLIGIQYIPPYSDMEILGDHQITCLSELKELLGDIKK
jgi:hypothetical protein